MRAFVIIWALACAASATFASSSDGLIAYYPLQTNACNRAGTNGNFILGHDNFTNGVLYVDGTYFALTPNYVGQSPIYRGTPLFHDFDYQSFTVGLDFYPLTERVAKPKQSLSKFENALDNFTRGFYRKWLVRGDWDKRNIITGGRSYRWIGFNRDDNQLVLTLNNQRFTHTFKRAPVKPNRWHHLLCSVNIRERKILTWLDGKELESVTLPQDFNFEILGSPDESTDQEFTFSNFSNGAVFFGYAADLRIFGKALPRAELMEEATRAFAQLPAFPAASSSVYPIVSVIAILSSVVLLLIWIRQRPPNRKPSVTPIVER